MFSEYEGTNFYGSGRCEEEKFPVGINVPSGFHLDGKFAPAGNIYHYPKTTLNRCGELCHSNIWCTFFSWKTDGIMADEPSWCYISAGCDNLDNTSTNGLDNESYKYDTYFITSRIGNLDILNSVIYASDHS